METVRVGSARGLCGLICELGRHWRLRLVRGIFLGRPRGFGLGLVVVVVEGAVAGAVEKARERIESAWGFLNGTKRRLRRRVQDE